METWQKVALFIALIILIIIIGVGVYASSGSSDDPDNPTSSTPKITTAVATYSANSTIINVTGSNFLQTSTWKLSTYSGTITYQSSTKCV